MSGQEIHEMRSRWTTVRWGVGRQNIIDAGDKLCTALGSTVIERGRLTTLLERTGVYTPEDINDYVEKGIDPDE